MGDYGRAFESALWFMGFVGVIIGLVFAGLIWFIIWLCHHVTIGWV